ncbi:hypothetical protein T459_03339 [Capsicum annuum]|uniref:Pentatricopeptide repeat-containing protein n=1 Tax=Capsicum annuum TaxID=4072 RepID=A0A2G3AMI9_CAPAN|nr:hypothetical protein T459_03339 [Capsicum annuum]
MFSRFPYRDVYSWTSMIHGYMKNGCSEVAVMFFEKMMVHEDVKCGMQIHAYMVKNEELSVFIMSALIAFNGKMSYLVYASKVLDTMVSKKSHMRMFSDDDLLDHSWKLYFPAESC